MLKRILTAVVLALLGSQTALTHDTWIEKRNGEILVLRGHGGTVEAYDPALVKEAKGLDVKGKAVKLDIVKNKENASLAPEGTPVVVAALYDSGYWLKTTDGWKKATKREGKGKYDIVQSLKSKQWCKGFLVPCAENSKPMGQRFEVVPRKDPATIHVGDKLPIKVLFDGKPVEGAIITTGGAHAPDASSALKTDKGGNANVEVKKAGVQIVKASHNIALKDDPDADVLSLASTVSFVAQ